MKLLHFIIIRYQLLKDWLWRIITGHSILHTVRITPQLYLGGAFSARGLRAIKKWGITAVIDLRMHKPPKGIKTLHLPTIDRTAPSPEDLQKGVQFIKTEINRGGKVYIHCRAGIGRGPTMTIAYLISIGYSLPQAINLIKKIRNFIDPTPPQLACLREFQKKYRSN